MLTTDETIQALGISRKTLYDWIKKGKLTAYQTGKGNRTYFEAGEVAKLAQSLKQFTPKRVA